MHHSVVADNQRLEIILPARVFFFRGHVPFHSSYAWCKETCIQVRKNCYNGSELARSCSFFPASRVFWGKRESFNPFEISLFHSGSGKTKLWGVQTASPEFCSSTLGNKKLQMYIRLYVHPCQNCFLFYIKKCPVSAILGFPRIKSSTYNL